MRKMKYSGIEWIGEIPEDWKILSHKNIMFKKKELCNKYNGEDILSLTLKGIIKRDLENPTGKMPATFDGYQRIEKGNLLLCLFDIDVTPRCVGLINDDGLTSPAYSQFIMKNDNNARYYNYLLRMIDSDKCFLHLSKNLRSSLTETDFGLIKSIMPPLEEQELIADYLDEKVQEIDNIISKTQETIEEYKKYKQSVITESVTKGLNPNVEMKDSGIEWIGEIPKHWKVVSLKKLIEVKDGTHDTPSYVEKNNNSFPFVTSKDFDNGKINFENVKYISKTDYDLINLRSKVDFGDVLMSMIGGNIGKTVIVKSRDDFAIKNVALFKTNKNKYFAEILNCYLQSELLQIQVKLKSRGGAQDFIGLNDIRNLIYFNIPLKEQKEIAMYLNKKCTHINELIIKKQELITQLETYKKSLIYECVTGKKEVALSYAY